MKNKRINIIAILLLTTSCHAASIAPLGGNPAGGEGYTYNLVLDAANKDTSSFQGTVGSWSWEDSRLPGDNTFWRHQSDWLAVTLTSDSVLRIQAERNDPVADIKLFPSFTVFRGFNDTTEGPHFGSNVSDLQWEAGSQLLEYVGHHNNSVSGEIDERMTLAAGDYTILFGGNARSEIDAVNVAYSMTLTAIPEPGSSLLIALGSILLLRRRNR